MGAAFGSGGSGSLFGASGSANFLSRTTAVLAGVFFVCTLALAYFGNLRARPESGSVLDRARRPRRRRHRPPPALPRRSRARACAAGRGAGRGRARPRRLRARGQIPTK